MHSRNSDVVLIVMGTIRFLVDKITDVMSIDWFVVSKLCLEDTGKM